MAQSFSSREELKRDLLLEWVKRSVEWVATHRQTFFSIVGTIAVAGIVIAFLISNFRSLRSQAWERYSAGQNWAMQRNPQNALNLYNDVINNYARTPALPYALLAKGDLLYQQRNFAEAITAYKECVTQNPPRVILPFAWMGLGYAQEDQNNFAEAIATYKQFVAEFPDHYFAPKIYESLARVYELSLNPDAAKEVYEKIITMFPGTIWSDKARLRYQALAPQPFQGAPGQAAPQIPPPAGQ